MANERQVRGYRKNPGEISPANLSPVTRELEAGTLVNLDGFAQYQVGSHLGPGIVTAKLLQAAPSTQPPIDIVLHSVNRSENMGLGLLEAVRRIELPAILGNLGASVVRPVGYLQTVEGQPGQEQVTGTYTVTELFGNFNADDLMEAMGRRLPPALVAQVILDVGKTLAIAHSQGIIYRDLKPSNVLVSDNPLVSVNTQRPYAALADWEKAYQYGKDPNDFSWGVGSPGFMPSEQYLESRSMQASRTTRHRELARDLQAISATTLPTLDIYAFGMTIYNMLGGANLPEFTEVAGAAVASGMPIPTANQSLIEGYDLDFIAGVGTALNKAIKKSTLIGQKYRYQSVKEMLIDLQPFLSQFVDPVSLNNYYASLP